MERSDPDRSSPATFPEEDAPFDASQYIFSGKGVVEDEGFGSVEDQLNSAVTGPKHPGVIDGGSGSFSRENLYQRFGKSINSSFHLEDGVKSYTSILGFCTAKLCAIVADSQVFVTHTNTTEGSNDAMKIIQVAPLIGMAGAGSQYVFQEVARRVDQTFRDQDSLDFSVRDVVDRVVTVVKESQESVRKDHPLIADHSVRYILGGRIHEDHDCEMYEIWNGDAGHISESGIINARRCNTRLCYAGSGEGFLKEYERRNPPADWVEPGDVATYSLKAMNFSLEKDEFSGGGIQMVYMTDSYNSFPFHESYVHGHWVAP